MRLSLVRAVLTATVVVAAGCELRPAADTIGFHFGYAVDPGPLASDPGYVEAVIADSNTITIENAMKWEAIHPAPDVYNFGPVDSILDFAVANGMTVRGHPLLWHSQTPAWLDAGLHAETLGTGVDDGTWASMWTRDELIAVMEDHIATVVGHFETHYPGVVTQYDVVNEPFWSDGTLRPTIWQQVIGDDYIELALGFARAATPTAELYVNDFLNHTLVVGEEVLSRGPPGIGATSLRTTCPEIPKCVRMQTWASDVVTRGIPLDGMGLEGHHLSFFGVDPPDYGMLMEWTAGLGLSWALTEVDYVLTNGQGDDQAALAEQAFWFGQLVDDCIGAPNCNTVIVWGPSDAESTWTASGLFGHAVLREENYEPKPALVAVWLRLVAAAS